MENDNLLSKTFKVISAEVLVWVVTRAPSINRHCMTMQITNSDWMMGDFDLISCPAAMVTFSVGGQLQSWTKWMKN